MIHSNGQELYFEQKLYKTIFVPKDGACFFHAVCDQLQFGQITNFHNSQSLRRFACKKINDNWNHLKEFIETNQKEEYLKNITNEDFYADHHLIQSTADTLQINIKIFQISESHVQKYTFGKYTHAPTLTLALQNLHFWSLRPAVTQHPNTPSILTHECFNNTTPLLTDHPNRSIPNPPTSTLTTYWSDSNPELLHFLPSNSNNFEKKTIKKLLKTIHSHLLYTVSLLLTFSHSNVTITHQNDSFTVSNPTQFQYTTNLINDLNSAREKLDNVINFKYKNPKLSSTILKLINLYFQDIHDLLTSTHQKLIYKCTTDEFDKPNTPFHNFTRHTPDSTLSDILKLGPSFIPTEQFRSTNKFKDEVTHTVLNLLLKTNPHRNPHINYTKPLIKPIQIPISKKFNSVIAKAHSHYTHSRVRDVILNTLDHLEHFRDTKLNTQQIRPTFSNHQLNQIKKTANKKDIIINISDKNLGFCMNTTNWYINESFRQLGQEIYSPIHLSLDNILDKALDDRKIITENHSATLGAINISFLEHRTKENCHIPLFNLLPKPHKLGLGPFNHNDENKLKGRPIISAHSWITVEPGKFLGNILTEWKNDYIEHLESHGITPTLTKNSHNIATALENTTFTGTLFNIQIITFDFESLYTNIRNEDVMYALNHLKSTLTIPGQIFNLAVDLFLFCQNLCYFSSADSLYLQKDGLAMGSYYSAQSADLTLAVFEENLISQISTTWPLQLFRRYLDDGLIITNINPLHLPYFTQFISKIYPKHFKITFNCNPIHNPFLDLTIRFDSRTLKKGLIGYNTFFKPASLYTYIPFNSNHPSHTYTGIIATEFTRYHRTNSNPYYLQNTIERFKRRLTRLGYPKHIIRLGSKFNNRTSQQKKTHPSVSTFITYPFSKTFNHKAHIQLITKPNYPFTFRIGFKSRKKLRQLVTNNRLIHLKMKNIIRKNTDRKKKKKFNTPWKNN